MTEKQIYQLMEWVKSNYEGYQSAINRSLEGAPEGSLRVSYKDGRPYYAMVSKDSGNPSGHKYISKKDKKTLSAFAQKKYDKQILPVVNHNLKAVDRFLDDFRPECMEREYVEQNNAEDYSITPYHSSLSDVVRAWENEEYESNNFHEENKLFQTDKGEMVRSKSEVIIANELFKYREKLLYKYERPLKLENALITKTFCPDFTTLSLISGRTSYWEHFGKMDDMGYVNDFMEKTAIYYDSGLVYGKNLFFTFEDVSHPLNIQYVKRMINQLL